MPTARERLNPRPDLSLVNPAVHDVTVDAFLLDGRPMDANVIEAIIDIGLERRIDGASTITAQIADPDLKLLNSPVLRKAVDLLLDRVIDSSGAHGAEFRLADIDLADNDGAAGLDLTFEATAVARLRRFTGAVHASRMDKTRAQFIKSLCDEAGVQFICPDLKKRQPIQSVEDAVTPTERKTERHKGIKKDVKLTVKGVAADSEQVRQMQRANDVADSLSAPALAQLAMNCAAIGESNYRAVKNQSGSKYSGVFQADPANVPPSDTEAQAHYFLKGGKGFQGGGAIALTRQHPDWSPGLIALTVEGSVSNFASRSAGAAHYDAHRAEAVKIMQAFGASGSVDVSADDTPETYAVPYMFKRLGADEASDGKAEDSWTCMRRLADEVQWRLWEASGAIFYMSDDRILRSAVQTTVAPGADGIDSVTGRLSNRKDRQELTVRCHARRWDAPPGTVAEVEGYGKFDGRWIVSQISRESLFTNDTTIALQQRVKALIEPAHEVRQRAESDKAVDAAGVPGADADGAPSGPLRSRIVAIAESSMTSKTGFSRYSQPGALTAQVTPPPPARTDCSQWIRAVYLKAGAQDPGTNTWEMDRIGRRTSKPKPGDIMLTANTGHCEIYRGGDPGRNLIGHGSPPIDYGSTKSFPGHYFVTYDFLDGDGGPPSRRGPGPNP
ncbi:MAG: hypothetical protein LC798_15550 [Chloroflexi bacterium]|nr:hypothetical protein [Chloroflexota bacterium]